MSLETWAIKLTIKGSAMGMTSEELEQFLASLKDMSNNASKMEAQISDWNKIDYDSDRARKDPSEFINTVEKTNAILNGINTANRQIAKDIALVKAISEKYKVKVPKTIIELEKFSNECRNNSVKLLVMRTNLGI